MAKQALPPAVELEIKRRLGYKDWNKEYPKEQDRLTAYRAAREQIEALVLAEEKTKQAREAAHAAREAQADLARWGGGGAR